ncbi:MAG: mechanosensitive ion channel family protein [Saprospiraceae bacterium]|nr:mechanosensitive ion channel family protein [Saprospiraceae bacterium]
MGDLTKYADKAIELAMEFGPKLILAILVLIIGFWLIKKVRKVSQLSLEKANFNIEIVSFLVSLLDVALKVFLLLTVAGMIGIETASLIGVLAAAGFAVGLALQGSLSNFAAGILILIFKPYRVGDWVEVQEKFGKVEEIQIFNTIIGTPGHKTLIIPNGQVIDGIVTNFSQKGHIRVELEVTMPYEESFPKVEKLLKETVLQHPLVLKDPEPEIGILTFDSHSIILSVRPYCEPDHYWQIVYDVNKSIKQAFHEQNIKVAYSEGVEIGTIGE